MVVHSHLSLLLLLLLLALSSTALAHEKVMLGRQLAAVKKDQPEELVEVNLEIGESPVNKRLRCAFIALRALKRAIYSDPRNITGNWGGPDVCSYNGVFCAPAVDDAGADVVAGLDLNGGDIGGSLPVELGLMRDMSVFHINSNRFNGSLPRTFTRLELLHELDLSNNNFGGPFPAIVLTIPNLRYLDLRYNDFEGPLPPALFDLPLDALFLNNNRFAGPLPANFGNSTVSVAVLAHNNLSGCIPPSIGQMSSTLEELLLLDNRISGCIPKEFGLLGNATVIDLSVNSLIGGLPNSFSGLVKLEQLNIGNNRLTGDLRGSLCRLPNLSNFSFGNNYFSGAATDCLKRDEWIFDDRRNCFMERMKQRSPSMCTPVVNQPVDCESKCGDRPKRDPPPLGRSVSTQGMGGLMEAHYTWQ